MSAAHHAAPSPGQLLVDEDDGTAPLAPARHPFLLALALVLVALNLRPALSSLGPVMPEIIRDTGVSPALAGALTTIPVVCLGIFGLAASPLAHRFGTERAALGALLLLAFGIALRAWPDYGAQLVAGIIAGAGIGVVGVLLPGVIKRDFPLRASLMMGVYTMGLCAGASAAAGVTVPLAGFAGGWPIALASWALPALAAAALWRPLMGGTKSAARARVVVRGLWRHPLAWHVMFYMGLQSSLAYIVMGWLAPMLRDRGVDPVTAGAIVSGSLLVQMPAALIAPILAGRSRSQAGVGLTMMACAIAGMLGCLYAPLGGLWVCALILGIGQGGNFGVALTVIVLRSADSHVAARLSGMAQSGGYMVAALGPLLVGLSFNLTAAWDAAAVVYTLLALAAALFCALACRPLHVKATYVSS